MVRTDQRLVLTSVAPKQTEPACALAETGNEQLPDMLEVEQRI
jgi:hypothetical protein